MIPTKESVTPAPAITSPPTTVPASAPSLSTPQPTVAGEQGVSTLTSSDGAAGDLFGVSVAISAITIAVGAYMDDDSGSVFIFTHNIAGTWTEQMKLKASDAAAEDLFGYAVAMGGGRLVVGAYGNGTSGSAYVFITRTGIEYQIAKSWTQQAKLTASDGAAGDELGRSVAISGDNIVIGANLDDDNGESSGSVYVFALEASIWTEEAKLLASDGAAADHFGNSVAIGGDIIAVGADWDDDKGDYSGGLYVFTHHGGIWTEEAKLIANDSEAFDGFGESVAIDGGTLVIGTSRRAGDSGTAYIFTRNSALVWSEEAKLKASDAEPNDRFGWHVAISGDTVVVSATHNGAYSGSAYVFTRSGNAWTEQAKLAAMNGAIDDYFGRSVAISGDTVVVGAQGKDANGGINGSVYAFDLLLL